VYTHYMLVNILLFHYRQITTLKNAEICLTWENLENILHIYNIANRYLEYTLRNDKRGKDIIICLQLMHTIIDLYVIKWRKPDGHKDNFINS